MLTIPHTSQAWRDPPVDGLGAAHMVDRRFGFRGVFGGQSGSPSAQPPRLVSFKIRRLPKGAESFDPLCLVNHRFFGSHGRSSVIAILDEVKKTNIGVLMKRLIYDFRE